MLAEQQQPKDKEQSIKWVTTRQFCETFAITRQTLHNWNTQSATKDLLKPHRQKQGNKYWYNIEGVIKLIEEKPFFFGHGREYHYKHAIQAAAEAKKDDNRFYNLHWKANGIERKYF